MKGGGLPQQRPADWNQWIGDVTNYQQPMQTVNTSSFTEVPYQTTYKAKPGPRTLILRWQDATWKAPRIDNKAQYSHFSFNLPRDVNGYNTIELTGLNYNNQFFLATGAFLMIGIPEITTAAAITSADSTGERRFIPTFVLPNLDMLIDPTNTTQTSPCQYPLVLPPQTTSKVNIRDMDLTKMTIMLGDESFDFLNVAGGSLDPDDYFLTLVFHLE